MREGKTLMKNRGCRLSCRWKDISTYRSELFGAAILSVVLYHYFIMFYEMEAPNKVIRIISKFYNSAVGSVGVDIFIILSGFGLYYSLSRRGSLSLFYRKRFQRVVLPYLVWGLFYSGFSTPKSGFVPDSHYYNDSIGPLPCKVREFPSLNRLIIWGMGV